MLPFWEIVPSVSVTKTVFRAVKKKFNNFFGFNLLQKI